MVTQQIVDEQLKNLGITMRMWGRSELKELCHILMPGEKITNCINGRYDGGFAMLCTTDQRVLLIDKKPMGLTVEDIRYDMISEVDFNSRMFESTLNIMTPGKTLQFTGFKQKPVRDMTTFIQNRVMEFRQAHMMQDMDNQPDHAKQRPNIDRNSNDPNNTTPDGVRQFQFRVTNPYTKVPLMMRRRVSRFYGSTN